MSLRDKIQRNEIDLSMNQLVEVPVKELAAAPKATHLDLSCNSIKRLPGDFATLTHLIKIDLRQNALTELPANFGNLINLQTLDLYENKIKSLPVSFSRLKNLRWLDLKNNPLEPALKAAAGDCLDEKQCQLCAKKVVACMQSIDSELERQKQKKLKEIRQKEAIEKEKVEKELEEQRKIKKLEKEKRKAELKAQREEKQKHQLEKQSDQLLGHRENAANSNKALSKSSAWFSTCFKFFMMGCLSVFFYYLYQDKYFQTNILPQMKATAIEYFSVFQEKSSEIRLSLVPFIASLKSTILELAPKLQENVLQFWVTMIPYFNEFKTIFLGIVHSVMLYVSEIATNVELMFGTIYFS